MKLEAKLLKNFIKDTKRKVGTKKYIYNSLFYIC